MSPLKPTPASLLGFPPSVPIPTLLSIAHLLPKSRTRCGIYLLTFESGNIYIGQAIEVVRRFSQHRRNYDDIVEFSFVPVPEAKLDSVEQKLIRQGESLGPST